MFLIFNLFVFIFGLIVGSFLNCLIYRLEKKESFILGRSFCPKCHHQLYFFELIPLLSFFILKGKCRYCFQKISWQYPLVELTTGLLFISIFNFQFSFFNQFSFFSFLELIFYFLITSFLIIIFVYDLKHYIIPDRIIYPAIVLVFFYQLLKIWSLGKWDWFELWNLGLGLLPSLFFLAINLISQGFWMGFGDFKLAVLMGLFVGFPNVLVAFFFSFFIGAIISIVLIILNKKTFKSEIPFGPFLVTGTFIALFWGQEIIDWYLAKLW